MLTMWTRFALLGVAVCGAGLARVAAQAPNAAAAPNRTLTAVAGIRVGHHTLNERPTGCTVILVDGDAVGGVSQRGGAPGTRETDLLDPLNMVDKVNAVVLSGGSAFGLEAAGGVMKWLDERGVGWPTAAAKVPIVVGAILYDLGVGNNPSVRPTADCGYRASAAASTAAVREGSIGAGAGATVGKAFGMARAMKGGVGTAAIRLPDGLIVSALVAVNAIGDVVDPATGQLVAGVRTEDGKSMADVRRLLRAGALGGAEPGANTTLAVVATNARMTKTQMAKVAQMAHDGFARAIVPVHTPADGDTAFAIATGSLGRGADLLVVGSLAADVTAQAILSAARAATGLPSLPAARDLPR
jgi:L-aminopeptidase/D-esterase-like protein